MKKIVLGLITAGAILISCKQESQSNISTEGKETDSISHKKNNSDTEHNAKNSLDWSGTYTGTIPCADCEGIQTTIVLNPDGTFVSISEYLPSHDKFEEKGNIMWHHNDNVVHLSNENLSVMYKVVENGLIQLDIEGKEITGSNKDLYRLVKKND